LADCVLGKWLKMAISPTTGPNDSISLSMMFVYYKDTKTLADLRWRSGCEK
jgi:hypothetical protein